MCFVPAQPQEEYFKEGGLWDIEKRLKEYEEKQGRKKAAAMLVGADLRERNINWYLRYSIGWGAGEVLSWESIWV